MNSPKGLSPLELQSLFDRELDAKGIDSAKSALSEEDESRIEALGEMRELVRFEHEQRVEEVSFDGLWSRIEADIDSAPAAPQAVAETQKESAPGILATLVAFFSDYRKIIVPTMAAALVAALVIAPRVMNRAPQAPELDGVRPDPEVVVIEPLRFEGEPDGIVGYNPESTPDIWYVGSRPADESSQPPPPNYELGMDYRPLPDAFAHPSGDAIIVGPQQIPMPIEEMMRRLERLERWAWPGHPPASRTGQGPAQVPNHGPL